MSPLNRRSLIQGAVAAALARPVLARRRGGVAVSGGALAITTTSPLPSATVGIPYNATMQASGGTTPYTWAITADSPDTGSWLSIDASTGALSGTPGTAETESLTIKVTDSASHTVSEPFTLVVNAAVSFNYYIGPSGSDSNAGTVEEPWAITSLAPLASSPNYSKIGGKAIGLLPGTYGISALMTAANVNDNNIALDIPGGTSSSSTYIASCNSAGQYSPRTATIQANDNGFYGGGNANKLSMIGHAGSSSGNYPNTGYVTFDGLVITGGSIWGLMIGQTAGTNTAPPGIIVQNCEITGFSGQDSTVASGSNLSPIQICSATGCIIQNNYIHDNAGWTDNEHFSAFYHWGLGVGTSGTQFIYNTIINSGGLQGKEGNQWATTIAYNYIDCSAQTPGGNGGVTGCIWGFNVTAPGSTSGATYVHHNILISYAGSGSTSPLQMATFISMTYANGTDLGWQQPLYIYNNTMIAASALNGVLFAAFEQTAGSKLINAYNNLYWDGGSGGYDAIAQGGNWWTNPDALNISDYNIYGTIFNSGVWALFSANGTQNEYTTYVPTFASFKSTTGTDAHSIANATNPFTNNGPLALQYQVESGSPAYNFGFTGGTSSGSPVNAGAWDGTSSVIGCNFA